jgi:hypothetical protein
MYHLPLNMKTGILEDLLLKQRRRRAEFLFLMSLLSVVAGYHADEYQLRTAVGLIVSSLGITWTLTQYRLQRRTLPDASSVRTMFNAFEAMGYSFVVILFLLAMILVPEHRSTVCLYVELALLSCISGTFFTEEFWIQRFFRELNSAQQLNFLQHLNSSLFRLPKRAKEHRTLKWNSTFG